MRITDILVNNEKEPLGMDILSPIFSWRIEAEEKEIQQECFWIKVWKEKSGEVVWDSGICKSSRSIGTVYQGKKLERETCYRLSVSIRDKKGREAKGETTFETGFLDSSPKGWEGAKWIGAPEFYLEPEAISVFSIESDIEIEDGNEAGLVFGANDSRLLNRNNNEMLIAGDNYISYILDISSIPAVVNIYRKGYFPEDRDDVPFASFTVASDETMQPVITEENKRTPHKLRIEVMGNAAFAYVDGVRVDSVKRRTFSGEKTAARQLNALGFNDITTYPRLCHAGYCVKRGTKARFSGITVKNVRKPHAVVAKVDENGLVMEAKDKDVFELRNLSQHALPMFRRDFTVKRKVESARLYATARGIYTVQMNGRKLTQDYFMPGASQYDRHLYYQTFDVTDVLKEGENGIGFTLSSGWWSDMSTYALYNYNYWGDRPSFIAKLVICYQDGTKEVITTDCDKWKYYGEGPFIYSGFFNGERFDGRKAWIYNEFSMPGFDISGMKAPEEITPVPIWAEKPSSPLIPGWENVNVKQPEFTGSLNAPVREKERFKAISMKETAPGVYIYDIGQEIAGIPCVYLKGKKGTRVQFRYGEMLYPELPEYGELSGRLLQANLREASNTDIYILSGKSGEKFQPEFTFHGFRYIEISGVDVPPELDEVEGILLSSVHSVTGKFECSNELVNKFVSNVKYSMLSNYISIPTDCPQRNERMGWTGDTHVFTRTATYQADVKNFLLRNTQAIKDLQRENGHLPNIAPIGGGFGGITYESALIIMTWELYQQYGDESIIRDNYEAMDVWMNTMKKEGLPGDKYTGFLGDWLAPDETDNRLVWNAFYGRDAKLMRRFSEILGLKEKAECYRKIEEETREYWNNTYVDACSGITKCHDGSTCDTQGSYVIGLDCEMFREEYRTMAVSNLVRKTEEAGWTVRTGFFGTGPLNRVLTENNCHDTAYRLITQTDYPSWLYPVTQGATTIWERWDSYTHEKGFGGNNAMNSFNHYSLGSVLSWCYEYILGIQRDETEPGYGHFYLKPSVYGFDYAIGGICTPYGRIESGWKKEQDSVIYTCEIPANTTAELLLEGERYYLGSGKYEFKIDENVKLGK